MDSKKLLILYDYFDPAFKAGGPIRSLVSLVNLLQNEFNVFVLCSNQDHDGERLDREPNVWLPYSVSARVMYLSNEDRKYSVFKKTINEIDPDVVYLNGVYSFAFFLYPLFILRKWPMIKAVIAPRGMLQSQSLSIKPLKKKLYLKLLLRFILPEHIFWHVTTMQEYLDLEHFTKGTGKVMTIGNVPAFSKKVDIPSSLDRRKLTLGTVALISPMKNIHSIINSLMSQKEDIQYEIYGPIKDPSYWTKCKKLINSLPPNVKVEYFGEVLPDDVCSKIAAMDFYIQPSKSENFGHSIFEAFNQGIPVIISDQTPWKGLQAKKAGWDVDLNDSDALEKAIDEALNMDDETYLEYRKGARKIAVDYMHDNDFLSLYKNLFSC